MINSVSLNSQPRIRRNQNFQSNKIANSTPLQTARSLAFGSRQEHAKVHSQYVNRYNALLTKIKKVKHNFLVSSERTAAELPKLKKQFALALQKSEFRQDSNEILSKLNNIVFEHKAIPTILEFFHNPELLNSLRTNLSKEKYNVIHSGKSKEYYEHKYEKSFNNIEQRLQGIEAHTNNINEILDQGLTPEEIKQSRNFFNNN